MGYENSGRRPQPTALKMLRGNPGKRKPNENAPSPPSGEILRPAWLTAGAAGVWDELAPICLAMGTLTVADVRSFAGLCELSATMQQASAAKDGRALFRLEQDRDDEAQMAVVIDATLKLERETANALRPYYEYFGLTPSSRARLSVPKTTDEPKSKWAGILK